MSRKRRQQPPRRRRGEIERRQRLEPVLGQVRVVDEAHEDHRLARRDVGAPARLQQPRIAQRVGDDEPRARPALPAPLPLPR